MAIVKIWFLEARLISEYTHDISKWKKAELESELMHLQTIGGLVLPRKRRLPKLAGIDYYVGIEPYRGCVGGDHLVVLNFNEYNLQEKIENAEKASNKPLADNLRKNLDRFGILVADVAGHMISDTVTVNYLHGAFKTGVAYELKYNGEVTPALFEMLNTDYYNRMTPEHLKSKPFVTLLYGEITSSGKFRYICAGHPNPIVFSHEHDKIVRLDGTCTRSSTPLGVLPSKYRADIEHFEPSAKIKEDYAVNEINLLGSGDIMLLHTDGLNELQDGRVDFYETGLEQVLRRVKSKSAKEIYMNVIREAHDAGPITDDATLAVIKKK